MLKTKPFAPFPERDLSNNLREKSAIPRICPECKKSNDMQTLVCACGFCFVDNLVQHQSNELSLLNVEKRKKGVKKVAILAGSITFLFLAAAYWGGFINSDATPDAPRTVAFAGETNENPPLSANGAALKNTSEYMISKVNTGDILRALDKNNQEYQIRIFGISAPKLDEDFGKESKENLSRLILGKTVLIVTQKVDDTGVIHGEIILDGANVGLEQIRTGMARVVPDSVNRQNGEDQRLYLDSEAAARDKRSGVWAGSAADLPITAVEVNPSAEVTGTAVKTGTARIAPFAARIAKPKSVMPDSAVPQAQTSQPSVSTTKQPPVVSPVVPAAVRPTVTPQITRTDSTGRTFILGPRGGCFYISSSGSKTYVDRSRCN